MQSAILQDAAFAKNVALGVSALMGGMVAVVGLGTWKAQAKAHREASILDQLADTFYTILSRMALPMASITHLTKMLDGVPADNWREKLNLHESVYGKEVRAQLNELENLLGKLRALVDRGVAYGFKDYPDFRYVVRLAAHCFFRVSKAHAGLGEMPEGVESEALSMLVDGVREIDTDQLAKDLGMIRNYTRNYMEARFKELHHGWLWNKCHSIPHVELPQVSIKLD